MDRLGLALLACVLASALGGCGDEEPNKPDDALQGYFTRNPGEPPPLLPGGVPPGLGEGADPLTGTGLGRVELTDELMADYVAVIETLKEAGTDTPGAALLAAHGLDWQRWMFIHSTIARSTVAANVPAQIENAEKALAQARAQAAQATEERAKAAFQARIQGLESQLASLRSVGAPSELDRRNFAVVRRWRERVEEAGR